MLVLQVEALRVTLTYSDLQAVRFESFQRLLTETGAQWSELATRTTPGLNRGEAYCIGTASWQVADESELLARLETVRQIERRPVGRTGVRHRRLQHAEVELEPIVGLQGVAHARRPAPHLIRIICRRRGGADRREVGQSSSP